MAEKEKILNFENYRSVNVFYSLVPKVIRLKTTGVDIKKLYNLPQLRFNNKLKISTINLQYCFVANANEHWLVQLDWKTEFNVFQIWNSFKFTFQVNTCAFFSLSLSLIALLFKQVSWFLKLKIKIFVLVCTNMEKF